jgi:hypothetical protein
VLIFNNSNILNNNKSILIQFAEDIKETIETIKTAAEQSQTLTSSANAASTTIVIVINFMQGVSSATTIGGFSLF